ncbi:MAG: mannose-1-phosphate guanylyltransferase/mannose-6-phosphate isomerase [Methylococcaceae bacterium]|nr:MAG: mannose-1-phosphate guanylyltransferase/mannose-6-phosphate isomerase [Methylococcaceae bacterium]
MLIPVILSGGAGTRLWPVSRDLYPKPFMLLPDGATIFSKTIHRAAGLPGVHEIFTVTNREHYFHTLSEYQQLTAVKRDLDTAFLLEPFGRNTAPAIALAGLAVKERFGGDATLLVLPADHLIENIEQFALAVKFAAIQAEAGKLVTFGIAPTEPETGYGYIESGMPIALSSALLNDTPHPAVFAVKRFVEKPDLATAKNYLEHGGFYWNSGMFCFTADTLLQTMSRVAPGLLCQAETCWAATRDHALRDGVAVDIDAETFAGLDNISFDYAVMEKADNVVMVSAGFDWNDIGSWSSVSRLVPADAAGNRSVGEAMLVDSTDTFVQSEDRLIAAVGVSNLLIVDTPDALLVADRGHVQEVRQVVARLKAGNDERHRLHRTVHRPWGTYTVLENGPRFKIKRLVVKPGATLSLQLHYHRSEHWVVVSGMARVINDEAERFVRTNESTYIPAGVKHRLENPGLTDLVIIEVQSGEYLGEDDIVRFDDQYGRKP